VLVRVFRSCKTYRMGGQVRLRASVLGLVALVAHSGVLHAEDADALVRKGIELRRAGDDQKALEVFRRAADIERTPRVLAQLGLAEQAVGQWVSAESDLKAALEAKKDRWIEKNRGALNDALHIVGDHLGSIEVWGSPDGAEVLVDGAMVGTLPASGLVRVPVGKVSLLVRHPGYAEATREVDVIKGGVNRESINLHMIPVEKVVATDQGAGAAQPLVAGGPGATQASDQGEAAQPEDHPFYKRWWFWTLVGVAAVGAGAGVYLATHGGSSGCDPNVPCNTWSAAILRAPIIGPGGN
jgi:PEGA domain